MFVNKYISSDVIQNNIRLVISVSLGLPEPKAFADLCLKEMVIVLIMVAISLPVRDILAWVGTFSHTLFHNPTTLNKP